MNSLNARLKNAKGERKLFISPRCKKIIDSIGRLSYIEGTNQIDKVSGLDHMFDAASYGCDFLFPIRTAHDTMDEPQRWTFGTRTKGW